MNKVYGGTVRQYGKPSLCLSCRHATVITSTNSQTILCEMLYGGEKNVIPQPVVQCSSYDDKSHPSQREFEKIAWVLNVDRDGNRIGFVNPRQWRAIEKKRKKEEGDNDYE